MGRSTGRSTPHGVDLLVHLNGNFNGDFTFPLLELILADEVVDLPTSSGV